MAAPRPPEPLFLERQTYRRRRLMDGARFLPVLGAVLFALPVLWAGDRASTAMGGLYVFTVWLALILAGAVISRRLTRGDPPPDAAKPDSAKPDDGPP